ncbi:MAG: BACON domain-containing protein [Rikenellaceae bacterium]|nr:BACON domain-containing protein [Rikenellaceae bacterium]
MRNKSLLFFFLILISYGCTKDEAPKIDLNISGGEISGQYQSSSQTVTFITNKSWTATVSESGTPSWISVRPVSGKAGTITLNVDMQANTVYQNREAVVTITAGSVTSTFRVRQEAAPPTVTIDRSIQNVGYEAGVATVAVSTNGAPWSLTGLPSWLTASSTSGNTAATITFTYQANELAVARVANLVFTSVTATKTHVMTQAAAPATIAIDQSAKTVESVSGSFSVAITTNSASWKASGIPAWVTLTPSENTGSGSVVVNYTQNTTNASREAIITFTAGSAVKTLTLTQLRTGGYIDGGNL